MLFIHQLPSQPSNLRVTTWRRLQQVGAIPLKQAVYALPDTLDAREDFEWLKTEVKAAGGDASVFAADNVDAWPDDAIVEEFRRARQETYGELSRDVEQALKRASSTRRPKSTRAPALRRQVDIFRERLVATERIDFSEGLQLAYQNDDALLEQGMTLFDSLYRSFEQSNRSTGPRLTARVKHQGKPSRSSRRGKKGR